MALAVAAGACAHRRAQWSLDQFTWICLDCNRYLGWDWKYAKGDLAWHEFQARAYYGQKDKP